MRSRAEPKLTRKSCGIRKTPVFYMLFGSIARAARCDFAAVTACKDLPKKKKQGPFNQSCFTRSRGQATFSVPNFVKKSFTCGQRSHRFTQGGFQGFTMVHLSPRSRSTCSAQSSMLYSIGGFSESPNLRKWCGQAPNLQRQKTRQSWFLSKPTQDKVRRCLGSQQKYQILVSPSNDRSSLRCD